jgi:hypothetical protein
MKKRIATLVVVGIFSLVSMGFRTPISGNELPEGSAITIVKGQVYNTDHDRYWEYVTFGVTGWDRDRYVVAFVDIFDRDGGFIARVDEPESYKDSYRTDWYRISLSRYYIKKDFTLEIHVVPEGHFSSTYFSRLAAIPNAGGAPIDPEETILIVKYP